MEYKVKLKKLNNAGTNRIEVRVDIVTQQQLSDLVEKFLSSDFETRKKMLLWK